MNHISTFFSTIIRSATDLSFYRTPKKFWSGFWYAYWLIVVLLFISGIFFAIRAVAVFTKTDDFLLMARQSLDEFYPAELKVSILSGSLTTNVQTPYALDAPPAARQWAGTEEGARHLVVIDPAASVEDYPGKDTFFLLTKNAAVYPEDKSRGGSSSKGSYRVISYDPKSSLTIDRASYDEVVTKLESFFPLVKPALLVAMVIGVTLFPLNGGFFVLAGYLFYLVISSFFLWILAALLHVPGGYVRVYILSLYGMTGCMIYSTLQTVGGFTISYVASLLFWGWMVVILVALRPREKKVVRKVRRK